MFKGVERQVVVLKNTDSKIFEEAIFVLRDNAKAGKSDMLTECERIIKANYTGRTISVRRKKAKLWLYGALIAAVVLTGIIVFLICGL